MIKGVSGAKIWSEDLNNLPPFYRDTLGLKVTVERPGFVVFGRTNASSLALGTHSEVEGKNADPARHMVDFETDDIQAEYLRLKSKGVAFIDEPTKFGQVIVATFRTGGGTTFSSCSSRLRREPRPMRGPAQACGEREAATEGYRRALVWGHNRGAIRGSRV